MVGVAEKVSIPNRWPDLELFLGRAKEIDESIIFIKKYVGIT